MLKLYVGARDLIYRVRNDESGASLAEYALLIALVLIGASAAVIALTTAVNGALGDGTTELNTRPA